LHNNRNYTGGNVQNTANINSPNFAMNNSVLEILLIKKEVNGKIRGLIKSKTGDHKFFVPFGVLEETCNGEITEREALRVLKQNFTELENIRLIKNEKLLQEFKRSEELKKLEIKRYKIGILCAKKGQTNESDILKNNEISTHFEEFLNLLGQKNCVERLEKL